MAVTGTSHGGYWLIHSHGRTYWRPPLALGCATTPATATPEEEEGEEEEEGAWTYRLKNLETLLVAERRTWKHYWLIGLLHYVFCFF